MKILILCVCTTLAVLAEPPVNNRYLPPNNGNGNGYSTMNQDSFMPPPPQTYGAPLKQTDAVFRPRNRQLNRPSQEYGAPSRQYGAPNNGQGFGSNQFGAQSAPSQQYGAPAAASRQYLPPGAGAGDRSGNGGYDDGSNGEPANYNFEYMVKDDESGNDFGHRESRQGDRAEGLYYVLLPDGRKQTVEYEADENGYRPKISYEDTGLGRNGGFGGYNSNAQNQGYQQNGY